MKAIFIPIQDVNHWNLLILSVEHLFHYDPLESANLFHNAILLLFFAKVWAIIERKLFKVTCVEMSTFKI